MQNHWSLYLMYFGLCWSGTYFTLLLWLKYEKQEYAKWIRQKGRDVFAHQLFMTVPNSPYTIPSSAWVMHCNTECGTQIITGTETHLAAPNQFVDIEDCYGIVYRTHCLPYGVFSYLRSRNVCVTIEVLEIKKGKRQWLYWCLWLAQTSVLACLLCLPSWFTAFIQMVVVCI